MATTTCPALLLPSLASVLAFVPWLRGVTLSAAICFQERQETPDEPEALKCIPSLALSDIPKEAASIPTAEVTKAPPPPPPSSGDVPAVHCNRRRMLASTPSLPQTSPCPDITGCCNALPTPAAVLRARRYAPSPRDLHQRRPVPRGNASSLVCYDSDVTLQSANTFIMHHHLPKHYSSVIVDSVG